MMYFITIIISLFYSSGAYPNSNNSDQSFVSEFNEIDHIHHRFSQNFYSQLLRQSQWRLSDYQTINFLKKTVQKQMEKGREILAAGLIIKNISLLNNNYEHPEIFRFIKILLDQNEWHSANLLFDSIKQEDDPTLNSNAAYLLSTYAFKRNDWPQTLKHITAVNDDLLPEEYHHALLLKGISLQRLSKHRNAIAAYKKVPLSSQYYTTATFNMAIASIRQGWWTEGHALIENALKQPETKKNEKTINRLYLTLAYSLLKKQYFRNARNAFRKIGTQSTYTNRALLGIALTAANQKDYIAALKVITILKEKETFDLSVDESFLLTPYFYEKLQQFATASSGYLAAITYYQKRISGINSILQSDLDPARNQIHFNRDTTTEIGGNPINFSLQYPDYFIENYFRLNSYKVYLDAFNNKTLTTEFKKLKSRYEVVIIKTIRSILKQRIKHLNSYMDQARYGLARLYDNNLITD